MVSYRVIGVKSLNPRGLSPLSSLSHDGGTHSLRQQFYCSGRGRGQVAGEVL